MTTVRGKTTAASTPGSFAAHHKREADIALAVDPQIEQLQDQVNRTLRTADRAEDAAQEARHLQSLAQISLFAAKVRQACPQAAYASVDHRQRRPYADGGYPIAVGRTLYDRDGHEILVHDPVIVEFASNHTSPLAGWYGQTITTLDDDETVALDLAEQAARSVEKDLARFTREHTRPSFARARTDVAIEDAMTGQKKVRWLDDDGDVAEGTVRGSLWTEDLQSAPAGTDPRDAYLRITLRSGLERVMSWEELAARHEKHELAFTD